MKQTAATADASAPTFEVRQVVHFTDKTFGPCASSARLGDPQPEPEAGATEVRRCFGVYRNDADGTQEHLEDFDTLEGAQASLKPQKPYTALQLTTQALKDILNAADNGQPYTRDELQASFQNDYNAGYEELQRQGLPEIA